MNAILILLLTAATAVAGPEWPDYRGPTRDGHARATQLPTTWSETEHVRWKTAIHDKGWSTPAVLGKQMWMTTARADGKALYVVCVDRRNGKILLDKKLFDVPRPRPLGNEMNSYASPSPVLEPGRVYVSFGSYGTACLEMPTGAVLWQRRDLPCNHFRGPGSSPVLVDNLLILHMDGSDYQYIVALDKQTGRTVWKIDRSTDYNDLDGTGQPVGEGDLRKAFNTPLQIRVDGQRQLISPSAKAFYAYQPETGREIWQVRHPGHSTAARAVYDGRLCYITTGSGHTEMLAIDPRGRGDITETNIVWRQLRYAPKRSSPVLLDGLIYTATHNGIVACVDAKTGRIVWRQRIGGEFSASLLYADGHIYIFNQQGLAVVIAPGRSYQQRARNRLDAGMMASPIALDQALYLRTKTHLYRIE
jgi:outer membrane protein assembly factor BamB